MEYWLIEEWRNGNHFPEGSTAVALTQEAVFYLERSGIKYITLEDFYTSGELRGNTDEFLRRELLWFEEFDDFLKEIFPHARKMNVDLASIYYYWIKHMVENAILTTRVLERFVIATKPTKIWFINEQFKEDKFDHVLSFKKTESTYSRLAEPVCKKYGVKFQRSIFDKKKQSNSYNIFKHIFEGHLDSGELRRFIKAKLPKLVLRLRKDFINILKNPWAQKEAKDSKHNKGCMLFLSGSDYIYDFCNDAKRYGFEVFLKQETKSGKLSWQSQFRTIEMEEADEAKISSFVNRSDIFKCFREGKLVQWLNEQCGLDVYSVVSSRFEFFLKKICPEILAKIKEYLKFYEENNIDFVATNMVWTIDDHAALAAARLSPSTKAIGFAHGADAIESKSRFFYLFRQFDLFFSFSKGEVEHQRSLTKLFQYPYPQVYEFPYFRKKYQRKFFQKSFFRVKKKPLALFVPIVCSPWSNRPMDLTQPFPMEYVKWHEALAEYLSKRDDYFFIWKGVIRQGQRLDLIAELIKDRGYKNIKFNSAHLTLWFPKANRVLCDVPSTAFFEAIYASLPALALHRPADQRLRENAYKGFGTSLQAYSNIKEGIRKVEEFLNSKKEKYIVPFSDTEISLPDILNSFLSFKENKKNSSRENRTSVSA